MQMIYDSDAFVVVAMNANDEDEPRRNGFEIVDKRVNKEVYLDGPWAQVFADQVHRWQELTPEQEEVEAILDSYCELAQYPLVMH